MQQRFTAQYFFQSGQTAGLGINVVSRGVHTVTLTDSDLTRGNDPSETLAASNGAVLFDGLQEVTFSEGRIVTVDDGARTVPEPGEGNGRK
ncbi:MAG: hypothetical protein ACK4MS_02900 [Paracoccaceae bacterium]